MIKAVFVDMDNTLIETQVLYDDAHNAFAAHVTAMTGVAAQDVLDELHARQIDLFQTLGYSANLVPQAYEDTLKHFMPVLAVEEIQMVRDFSRMIFEREAAIKSGVEHAIQQLAQHYPVYLVTVGDQTVQQSRVDVLPFKHVFSGVFIVDHKNAETYRHVLQAVKARPEETVMIGDSLNSDILPALENGMNAIYIPAQNWTMRENHGAVLPDTGVTVHVTFTDATVSLVQMKQAAPKPRRRNNNNGPRR